MPHSAPNSTASAPAPPPAQTRLRFGKLCVAVQGVTSAELFERAAGALKDARFVEFRLDALAKPASALPQLKEFLASRRDVTAIATCRRKEFGGKLAGTLNSELEILLKAAEAGCQIVDLEVESAEQASKSQLVKFRAALRAAGAALLISSHDFTRTKGLEKAAERIEAFDPDFVKVVSTARSLADNLAVLRLIENQSLLAQVVGIAMGEEGLVSRVLGPRAGAAFTFAASGEGEETAPGQATVRALVDLYRVEQLDQATRIFGVAGNPIGHALSPLMHNTAFRRESVNAVMLPLKVKDLDDLLTLIRDLPLAGVSVTMPLKQQVLPHLANMDPLTARIGACNTLRTGADGKLYGFNTDVAGVVRPLEKRMKIKGARILVLGAGSGLWPRRAGRGGLHRQPHPRKSRIPGTQGQSQSTQAGSARQKQVRRHRQHHPLRHGRCQAGAAAERKRTQCRPGLRHGLQPARNPAPGAGALARPRGHQRP